MIQCAYKTLKTDTFGLRNYIERSFRPSVPYSLGSNMIIINNRTMIDTFEASLYNNGIHKIGSWTNTALRPKHIFIPRDHEHRKYPSGLRCRAAWNKKVKQEKRNPRIIRAKCETLKAFFLRGRINLIGNVRECCTPHIGLVRSPHLDQRLRCRSISLLGEYVVGKESLWESIDRHHPSPPPGINTDANEA